MPPKKKQQQIDLSTLPECVSTNAIIFCKGKKQRSQKIINKLFSQYKSLLAKLTKQQVLDHAKQKNIYVDPNTLNDKQKKDPKFMESICTELTPEVIAKATKSLIQTQNIKIRLQLKAQNDKPQAQRAKPIFQKKLDQIYFFNDFPEAKDQFQALANINQNIKFILVINPLISWTNAPQLNQEEQPEQGQEPAEQDQQVKQFKQLKRKQQFIEQDKNHQNLVQSKINILRNFRKQVKRNSNFRDCLIQYFDCEIDPYNQQKSINEAVKNFILKISKLYIEYDDFIEWKKDKVQENIVQEQIQQQQPKQSDEAKKQPEPQIQKISFQAIGQNTTQILTNFVDYLFGVSKNQNEQNDDVQDLINGFSFQRPIQSNLNSNSVQITKEKKKQFYSENENLYKKQFSKNIQQNFRNILQYPGINRYLMPDIPLQSAPLRKMNRSQYVQFLNQKLPYEQFERRISLHKFEQIIKQIDEDRHYNFNDRIYQQNHDQKSLMRQLYRAISMNDSHFLTKYNQQNDKLYVVLLYKNNQRRTHFKKWQANWKVLPNYQSWLKYFKENQTNLNTQAFYKIDYEKIGHINDQVYAFSVPDGGVLVSKQSTVAGNINQFLYGIKNHHFFGLNNNNFYSQNKSTKVYHYAVINKQQNKDKKYETIIQIDQNMRIRLQQSGDVLIQSKQDQSRVYTPDGYTIIYDQKNNYKILHPNGGVTQKNSYINQKGFGMKNGQIYNVPTLLRRTDQFQIIKRDDNTVTVKDKNKKWIKYFDGTEYMIEKDIVSIQKQRMPFIKCQNNQIQISINDIIIKGTKSKQNNNYTFTIKYADGNTLKIQQSKVQVTQLLSQIPYIIDIDKKCFDIQFNNQKLQISKEKIKYFKNGQQYNPKENQQLFGQNQSLPIDYIQPRLFIISPQNTGVQYLSQKQLQYYFNIKSNPKNNVISKIPAKNHETIHIVSRIIDQSELNNKKINPNFDINLDIFKSQKYQTEQLNIKRFAVRTFIKHMNLQPEDQQELNSIKQKHQTWLKFMKKEQNQYGFKPKDDPSLLEIQKQKTIMISFRKKQIQKIDFQKIKQTAILEWNNKQKQNLNLIAQKEQQEKIKNQMKKRKKSYKEEYPPLIVKQKQQIYNTQIQSQADFYIHYFETTEGRRALAEMPEWVFRPKTSKQQKQLDPEIVTELQNTMNKINKQQDQASQEQRQRYDTVDVKLNPVRQIIIKPSVFTQRQIDQERQAFQQQKKAYYYHQKKRKEFDIFGAERGQKIQVKSLLRTQPISEINQKYLITEAPFDKKVKISSMKNKLTSQASSLVQMRKEGPHNTLLKTLDKRNDYNTLLEKRTMMVHADLNDKLQRDILITPVQANFGFLKQGKTYELKINVKNQDILAQRLVVKKPKLVVARVHMSQMGPIALGMSRKIIIQLKAASQYLGRYTDEFQIVSKHQIYKIPIMATILSENQFQNENIQLSNLVKQVQELPKKKISELPPIN